MKKAFTLAEILISLGIIGVLAALTIPELMVGYQKIIFVAQIQKFYNTLKSGAVSFTTDSEAQNLSETDLPESSRIFVSKYLGKVVKFCGEAKEQCLADSYKSLDYNTTYATSSFTSSWHTGWNCVLLDTKAAVCVSKMADEPDYKNASSEILLDVNGKDAPNVKGRDFFDLRLYSDGKISSNSYREKTDKDFGPNDSCVNNAEGYGTTCFDRIRANSWVMDY